MGAVGIMLLLSLLGALGWWRHTQRGAVPTVRLRLRVRATTPHVQLAAVVETVLRAHGGTLWVVAEPPGDALVLEVVETAVEAVRLALHDAAIDHHLVRVRHLNLPTPARWAWVQPTMPASDLPWYGPATAIMTTVHPSGRRLTGAVDPRPAPTWRVWRLPVRLAVALARIPWLGRRHAGALLPDPRRQSGWHIPALPASLPTALPQRLHGPCLDLDGMAVPLTGGQRIQIVGAPDRVRPRLVALLEQGMTTGAGSIAWLEAATVDAWLPTLSAEQRNRVVVVDGRAWATTATLDLTPLADADLAALLGAWAGLDAHDPARQIVPGVIAAWRRHDAGVPTLLALLMECPAAICANYGLTGMDRQLIRMRWMTRLRPFITHAFLGVWATPASDLHALRAAGATIMVVAPADPLLRSALRAAVEMLIDAMTVPQRPTLILAEDGPLAVTAPEPVVPVWAERRGRSGWHWSWCVGGTTPTATVPFAHAGIAPVSVACLPDGASVLVHPTGLALRAPRPHGESDTPLLLAPQRAGIARMLQHLDRVRRTMPTLAPCSHLVATIAAATGGVAAVPTVTIHAAIPDAPPLLPLRLADALTDADGIVAHDRYYDIYSHHNNDNYVTLQLAERAGSTLPWGGGFLWHRDHDVWTAYPWATIQHLWITGDPDGRGLAWVVQSLVTTMHPDRMALTILGVLPDHLAAIHDLPHATPTPAGETPADGLRALLDAQVAPDADDRHAVVLVVLPTVEACDLPLFRALVQAFQRSRAYPLSLIIHVPALPPACVPLAAQRSHLIGDADTRVLHRPDQPAVAIPVGPASDWRRLIRSLPMRSRRDPVTVPDLATFWGVDPTDLAPSLASMDAVDGAASAHGGLRSLGPQPLVLTEATIHTIVAAALRDPQRRISPKMLRKLFPDPLLADPDWGTVAALAARLPTVIVAPKNGHGSYTVHPTVTDAAQVQALLGTPILLDHQGATHDHA